MNKHSVTLPSGQTVSVTAPPRLSFDPPVDPTRARYLLAAEIAQGVERHIVRRPTIRRVVRNHDERIVGMLDADADAPVREQAWRVGTEIAAFLIPLDEPDATTSEDVE